MEFTRDRIVQAAWRVSIFLLPWQIRFFVEAPPVNGLPWENGRLSFYASWIPMFVTIVFQFLTPPTSSYAKRRFLTLPLNLRGRWRELSVAAGILLIFFVSIFTIFPRATLQWWIQVVILFLFCWSLIQLRIDRQSLIKWFLISLVPHALLGIWQYVTQFVHGSKWLGMASQDPMTRGVSVIEIAGRRILRAYGGFPHPNIFGGWLAVGLTFVASSMYQVSGVESRSDHRYTGYPLLILFTTALFFTFARGPWIACLVGLLMVLIVHAKTHLKQSLVIALVFLATVSGLVIWQRDVVLTRIHNQERLEQKSTDERVNSIKQGWELWKKHPLTGIGPGTAGLALNGTPSHFLPLIILDEVGLLGLAGLIILIYHFFCFRQTRFSDLTSVLVLFLLGLFDYYSWSFWSGQTLVVLALTTPLLFWHSKPTN